MRRLTVTSTMVLAILLAGAGLAAQQPAGRGRPGSGQAPAAAGGRRGLGPQSAGYASFERPTPDPAKAALGEKIFAANCSFCHGDDARGGDTGPNLIRAQPVLDDQNGEIIGPIVHGSLQAQGMPKFDLSQDDIVAVAAWLHTQQLGNRGARTELNVLVGDAAGGKAYFNGAGKCSSCHSVTGDLAGIGAKYTPKDLQNLIVAGAAGGRGVPSGGKPVTVTVTLPSGQAIEGRLDHVDAFAVSLIDNQGTYRSFVINGDTPKVTVHLPQQAHLDMLAHWKDSDIHNLTAYLSTLK